MINEILHSVGRSLDCIIRDRGDQCWFSYQDLNVASNAYDAGSPDKSARE